ncbi:MAG: hypothetical protein WC496_04110 [Phycisphaerae bacterium]|jgi:Leucine-rich repeat (LRR) protein
MKKFDVKQGKYGKKLVLTTGWSKQITEYFLSNKIKELDLNIAFGWNDRDLEFLKELKGLLSLDILAGIREDISPIHYLSDLKELTLQVIHKTKIDFSCFPKLEKVGLDWSPKIKSVLECKSLKRILMCKYKSDKRDLSAFSNLPNLEELCFKICNIERIGDISNLKNLQTLELHWASKLTSLKGLEVLKGLQILHIDTCRRVNRIDAVGKLEKLEEFYLPNCKDIESLKPMANLKNLRIFEFPDSTNIVDGDLTVLKKLPKLSQVCFVDRRHYNLKESDMPGYQEPDWDAMRKSLLKSGLPPAAVDYILK